MSLKSFNYPVVETRMSNPDALDRLPLKSPCAGLGYKSNVGAKVSYNYDFSLKSTEFVNIFGVILPVVFLSPCTVSMEGSIQFDIFTIIFNPGGGSWTNKNLKLSFILNRPNFSLGDVIFPLPAIIVVAIENGYFEIETYLYTITFAIDRITVVFVDIWLVICANPSPPMSMINAYFVFTIESAEMVLLNVGVGVPLASPNLLATDITNNQGRMLVRQSIGGSLLNTVIRDRYFILHILKASFVGIKEEDGEHIPIYVDNSYNFYLSDGSPVQNLVLYRNESYSFARYNDALENPFYISDVSFNAASEAITISGDGSYNNGITGTQSFTLNFNLNFNSSEIYYYSTDDSSMNGIFMVNT